MTVRFAGTSALVTGASSGLGTEFARVLAARGADLVLVARRLDRLEALARDLEARHGITARVLGADLSEPASWGRVKSFTDTEGVRVATLVNNAGFATHGVLAEADPARTDEEVRLNVGALTALTVVPAGPPGRGKGRPGQRRQYCRFPADPLDGGVRGDEGLCT
ncbi:SDR family NAD(P)-dependent oxidoreductase [Arthrobacter sp. TMS1-12-1]